MSECLWSTYTQQRVVCFQQVLVLGQPPFQTTSLCTSGDLAYVGGNWTRDIAFAGNSIPLTVRQGGRQPWGWERWGRECMAADRLCYMAAVAAANRLMEDNRTLLALLAPVMDQLVLLPLLQRPHPYTHHLTYPVVSAPCDSRNRPTSHYPCT